MSRYVPIYLNEFATTVEPSGFQQVSLPGVHERVWERRIPTDANRAGNYVLRIYSTIEGSVSRESGEDAIRVLLIDLDSTRPLSYEKRVHRTKNALPNTIARCRDVWSYATNRQNRCPVCNRLMQVVTPRATTKCRLPTPFLSCTGYSTGACRHTQPVPERLDAAA